MGTYTIGPLYIYCIKTNVYETVEHWH